MAGVPGPRQRRKIQGVTMTDVAREAGVSPSTVSLFLRRPDEVSPNAGQIIQNAINKLDYVPNMIAGGLAAATSRVVGVVVPSVRNAFFAETVAALQRELRRGRLQMLLGHSEYDLTAEEDIIRTALSWAPAAMIIAGLDHSAATKRMLKASGIPVVEIWELGDQPPLDLAVGFNHQQVGAMAARHLVTRGRRNLIYFSARIHEDKRAAQRAEGFLAAAEALGVPARHMTHPAAATTEIGGILMARLLGESAANDAVGIACSNDHIALGALFEAQRAGKVIPRDYAVIGFGDLAFAGSCNPSLTTIRPAGDLIGREAARLVLARLESDDPAQGLSIDTGFSEILRQST